MLEGKKTIITASVMGFYNVAIALWPNVSEFVSPDLVNSLLGTMIAIFMRIGIGSKK